MLGYDGYNNDIDSGCVFGCCYGLEMVIMIVLTVIFVSQSLVWSVCSGLVKGVSLVLGELVQVGVKWWLSLYLMVVMVIVMFANVVGLNEGLFSMMYPVIMVLSVVSWSVVIMDDMSFSGKFISHFVPVGVSLKMGLVMGVLELFSHLIRPLTLCVRLATNITAGHVMLLMFSGFCYSSVVVACFVGVVLFLVVLLELVVSLLQSYIFSSLLELYHSEFV